MSTAMLNPESDLYQALDYNGLFGMTETISSVELEITGYADGPAWHWIVKLEDDTYSYITAACTSEGWHGEDSTCETEGEETLEELWRHVDEDTRTVFAEMLEDGDTQRDAFDF